MAKRSSLFLLLVIVGVGSTVVGKQRFLHKQLAKEELESSRDQVVSLAVQLAQEKKERVLKCQQERVEKERQFLQSQMNTQMNKLTKKREAKIRRLVLKARVLEKKRRLRYKAWHNYISNRKAAQRLVEEVRKIDCTNHVHVQELRDEISEFAATRLRGRLYRYAALNDFMG